MTEIKPSGRLGRQASIMPAASPPLMRNFIKFTRHPPDCKTEQVWYENVFKENDLPLPEIAMTLNFDCPR
jgi:hypothetical protein